MARQFNRQYELLIDADGERRIITDLRLKFEATKSIRSYPNLAKIEVYNPNQATRKALGSRLTSIRLSAGYAGNYGLIFSGRIRNTTQSRTGADHIVTIYCGDGQRDWEAATYNKTYASSTGVASIISDIAGSFSETAIGFIDNFDASQIKATMSGSSKDILDDLADNNGFQWSIQDGVFEAVKSDSVTNGQAVLITSRTGMIGAPTITETGADIKSLLNPRLKPNSSIKVESVGATVSLGNLYFRETKKTQGAGFYKIAEVKHVGDTHDNLWESNVIGWTYVG